jgi:hypothetical protein
MAKASSNGPAPRASDLVSQIKARVGDTLPAAIYRDRVRTQRTRSYRLNAPRATPRNPHLPESSLVGVEDKPRIANGSISRSLQARSARSHTPDITSSPAWRTTRVRWFQPWRSEHMTATEPQFVPRASADRRGTASGNRRRRRRPAIPEFIRIPSNAHEDSDAKEHGSSVWVDDRFCCAACCRIVPAQVSSSPTLNEIKKRDLVLLFARSGSSL